jgi:uncharacterized protein YegL
MALQEVTTSKARPLPVILLLDVSGSMSVNSKIDVLNQAVQTLLDNLAAESAFRSEIQVAILTFGDQARIHLPLTPAKQVQFTPLSADGVTPLGATLTQLRSLLEDPAQVPSRAYRPTVVLVSDGQPNDDWQGPLSELLASSRASKAFRLAMGIGDDADLEGLRRFLDDPMGRVFQAHDARQLHEFFQWVTMSVAARSRSATPDSLPALPTSGIVRLQAQEDLKNIQF